MDTTTLSSNISALDTALSSLYKRVTVLESGTADIDKRISTLNTSVTTAQSSAKDLTTRIATLESKWSSTGTTTTSTIANLEKGIIAINTSLQTISTQVLALEGTNTLK